MKNLKSKILNIKSNSGPASPSQGGFTLIETLVAVLVLSIALNGILTLVTSSIFSARYAKNEITAMYLAQEAIDHVRNDRDTMVFNPAGLMSWDNFLVSYGYNSSSPTSSDKCFANDGCRFEATNWEPSDIRACSGLCEPLYYNENASNSTGNYYYYPYSITNDTKETSFRRKISMKVNSVSQSATLGINEELVVTVKIDWRNGNSNRSQTLTTSLLNW